MTNESPRRGQNTAGAIGFEHQQLTARTMSYQPQNANETACQFLRLILPEQGHYVAMIVESEQRRHNEFAQTIERLWEIIKEADRAGYTAYHACASFREAIRDPRAVPRAQRRFGRTKRNAFGAKALWMDVDAGPDKPYQDHQAAESAVRLFCSATGLPTPLYVLSGLGLHVYWPLEQTLDAKSWGRYAHGLKALCVTHGLDADPARTADIASVLRTPGTHHRKAGVRLVQCGDLVGPYSVELFEILLSASADRVSKASAGLEALGPMPLHLVHFSNRESAKRSFVIFRYISRHLAR